MFQHFISTKSAEHIVKVDNVNMDPAEVKLNVPQTEVLCNTWLNLMYDITQNLGAVLRIRDALYQLGLVQVAKAGKSLSNDLLTRTLNVSGDTSAPDLFWSKEYESARDATHELALLIDICRSTYTEEDCMRNVLQLLQFPARFTYIMSFTPKETYNKFFMANDRCKEISYNWDLRPRQTILMFVKAEMARIFTVKDFCTDMDDGGFSDGALRDHVRTQLDKWRLLSEYYPNYKGEISYPLVFPDHDGNIKGTKRIPTNIPFLMAVPKTLDEKRIIAPEGPVVNYNGRIVLKALRRMLEKNGTMKFINEEDQSVNRLLAQNGSAEEGWCTIDMSSASDTICRDLFIEVLPNFFKDIYLNLMSGYAEWCPSPTQHAMRKLFMLFTSGNPLTWLTEACWFLALGRVAATLAGDRYPNKHVYAYGDDLIVRTDAYQTTIELLECFGHKVNVTKSYGSGVFRESCGGWYFRGHDVTPSYWPRSDIQPRDLVWTVCDLQHKLFAYEGVKAYLEETALALNPKMTYSPQGEDCDDLWLDLDRNRGFLDLGKHLQRKIPKKSLKCDAFAQHLAYYQFLQYGPMYNSPLDELLGVSSSRLAALLTVSK